MPHIVIKLLPGRTDEVKGTLADEVGRAITRILGVSEAAVSVAIIDVASEDWQSVFDSEIRSQRDVLYKVPGYGGL